MDEVVVLSDEDFPPSTELTRTEKWCAFVFGGATATSFIIDASIYFFIFGLSYLKSIDACRWTSFTFAIVAVPFGLIIFLCPPPGRRSWLTRAMGKVISVCALIFSAVCMAFFVLSFVSLGAIRWAALASGVSYFIFTFFSCGLGAFRCCKCARVIAIWGWHPDREDIKTPT